MRRLAPAVLSLLAPPVLLVAGLLPPAPATALPSAPRPAPPASAGSGSSLATVPGAVRVGGGTRYDTAVALSRRSRPAALGSGGTVVLASGEQPWDALAGGPAASRLAGPLLLTAGDALPPVVADELRRLAPARVLVLGGPSAVPAPVLDQVRGAVPAAEVRRLAGADRYATAAAVLDAVFVPGGDDDVPGATAAPAGPVYAASGEGWADALAAGPAAGRAGSPLLLVRPDGLPAELAGVLDRWTAPSREIVVLGGSSALPDRAATALGAYGTVRRVQGGDRYGTAAALATQTAPSATRAYVVSGSSFADALGAGPAAAAEDAPLVLAPSGCLPRSTSDYLDRARWPALVAVGGTSALSASVTGVVPCSRVPDEQLAPGIAYRAVVLPGPVVARVLTVDRRQGAQVTPVLSDDTLTGTERTTDAARRWGAVAAVNADYFYPDGRPVHALASQGRLLQSPLLTENQFTLTGSDAFVGGPVLGMTATLPSGQAVGIGRVNAGTPDRESLALYTPEGGSAEKVGNGTCSAALTPVGAPTVRGDGRTGQDWTVEAVRCGDPVAVGAGQSALAAAGGTAASVAVAGLAPGATVSLDWSIGWPGALSTVGGNPWMVSRGQVLGGNVDGSGGYFGAVARTGVGIMSDGRLLLVEVDRQPGVSRGLTLRGFAQLMADLGSVEAMNLDGGGSSTVVVRGVLQNAPSDGSERPVGTHLVVTSGEPVRRASSASASTLEEQVPAEDGGAAAAADPGSLGGLLSSTGG